MHAHSQRTVPPCYRLCGPASPAHAALLPLVSGEGPEGRSPLRSAQPGCPVTALGAGCAGGDVARGRTRWVVAGPERPEEGAADRRAPHPGGRARREARAELCAGSSPTGRVARVPACLSSGAGFALPFPLGGAEGQGDRCPCLLPSTPEEAWWHHGGVARRVLPCFWNAAEAGVLTLAGPPAHTNSGFSLLLSHFTAQLV